MKDYDLRDLMARPHRSGPFASLRPPSGPRAPLSHDELRDVMELTLWTAQLQLKSGAQSARVERTAHLLGSALGADWLDVLVMQEGVLLTTSSGAEFRTRVRRVSALGVNLSTLVHIAQMTAKAWKGDLDRHSVRKRLEELDQAPPVYPRLFVAAAVGIACGAFSSLFGGDLTSCAITTLGSALSMYVRQTLVKKHYNPLLSVIAIAFLAGLAPALAHVIGWLPAPEAALAASVLLLVPGVPFINAARDVLRGYMVAGIARGFQALLVSLCIALGLGTALTVCGLTFADSSPTLAKSLWIYIASDGFWSGLAAGGFAVLFNVPRASLLLCVLAGALGHAFRTFLTIGGLPLLSSTLIAATALGLMGEIFARRTKAPAGLIAVPGAIPLVPGVLAFRSMSGLLHLISPKYDQQQLSVILADAARNFSSTGLLLAGIALGIALPSLVFKRERAAE